MPTTNLCENCHTTGIGTKTPSWAPSKFDHTQMTVTTCQTCHSGTVKITTGFVSGQPTNHVPPIPSAIDCGVCHGNKPAAETWTVLAASIATLHTGLPVSNCLLCHAGQTFAGVPAPYIPMSISGVSPTKTTPLAPPHIPILAGTDCSACHGAAYQAGGFGPATAMSAAKHAFVSTTCDTCHDTGKSFYVGSGTPLQLRPADHVSSSDPRMATSDCSVCHETKDWVSTVLPVGHMPNPGNLACAQCHTSAPSDYTPATLAANAVLHTGITANCGLCHGNTTTALTWFNNFTPKDAMLTPAHIPYLSGTDCSSCHSSTTYAVGGFGPTNMSAAKHAFVPTACDTCHEAGLELLHGRIDARRCRAGPADHLASGNPQQASGDCSGCHHTTDWTSNIMPAGHMPNPGNQACAVCHTAIGATLASYATLASIAVLHTGISGNCGQCHGATTQLTFYNNNDNPKSAVLTPAHIPYLSGTDCSSCHAANYVAGGFGPTNMSAAKHAFVPTACDTCHEAGLSFYLGASTPALQGRPTDHMSPTGTPQQQTGDCSGCHNTTDWTTNAMPAGHMPNPGNQACSVCHTAISGTRRQLRHAREHRGAAHRHQRQLRAVPRQPVGSAHLLQQQRQPARRRWLSPAHIPYLNGADCSSCHAANYVAGGFGRHQHERGQTRLRADDVRYLPRGGDDVSIWAHRLRLCRARPAGHVSTPNPPSPGHRRLLAVPQHDGWTTPTTLPDGHMPIPGKQTCSVCHVGNLSTPDLCHDGEHLPILHTGITTGCAQCHGGATALTFYNNNDNPQGCAALARAYSRFHGEDCSACHTPNYAAGGFGPMNMTQATHAGVSATTCNTCHEAGLSFYMGAASPGPARPAGRSHGGPAGRAERLQPLPHHGQLEHHGAARRPHAESGQPGVQCLPHRGAHELYDARGQLRAAYRHQRGLRPVPRRHAALTWYNNFTPKDAVLAPAHIPYPVGNRLRLLPQVDHVRGRQLRADEHDPGHARLRATTCIPATRRVELLHGRGKSRAAGPAGRSHLRPDGGAERLQPVPHHGELERTTMPAGHMPNPANQACTVCHTAAPSNYMTLAATRSCTPASTAAVRAVPRRHDGAHLVQQLHAEGCGAPATHIPVLVRNELRLLPLLEHLCGRRLRADEHDPGDACLRRDHLHHLPREGPPFYMGAANPALQGRPADHTCGQMVAPNNCSLCHTTANWN